MCWERYLDQDTGEPQARRIETPISKAEKRLGTRPSVVKTPREDTERIEAVVLSSDEIASVVSQA